MYNKLNIANTLYQIRQQTPLIHNITNIVVSHYTANILLSLGASPAMVNEEKEVGEFVKKANALVINLGTITHCQVAAMNIAASTAYSCHIPWILDPVGIGVSTYRCQTALELMAHHPTAIRGNAAEIITLYHLIENLTLTPVGRGVDSLTQPEQALKAAKSLALSQQTIVSISGQIDYITDGEKVIAVSNGHPLMGKITGSGCSATAITAGCLSVEENKLEACAHAMVMIGIAGEVAAQHSKAPGSFQIALLDELFLLNQEKLTQYAKIEFLS